MSGVRHFVQTFRAEGDRLVADYLEHFKTANAAVETAELLAEGTAGVMALSVMLDADSDIIGWPIVLFRAGRVPRDFAGEE